MRIEFILTSVMELSHFAPVIHALRELDQDATLILPPQIQEGRPTPFGWSDFDALKQAIIDLWPKIPCEAYNLAEADVVVSTHPATFLTPYKRAVTFRMMYGAGVVRLPDAPREPGLPSDFYLVHGPLSAQRQFEDHVMGSPLLPKERVKVIGYPRLDGWWKLAKQEEIPGMFRSGGPLLLWLPTWSVRSSIDIYIDEVAKLQTRFTLQVRPHHCTTRWERVRMFHLKNTEAFGYDDPCRDTALSYAHADIILADLSSGAFTEALLTGKPVVGLTTPEEHSRLVLPELDRYVPIATSPDHLSTLIDLALDDDWTDWHKQSTRDSLFTTSKGEDGMVAAKAIVECLRG